MILSVLFASLISFATALSSTPTVSHLQKREHGDYSSSVSGDIIDFSPVCHSINYPIQNGKGQSVMETLYSALATTTVPVDTIYQPQENIICTVPSDTPNITATIGSGVSGSLATAGASLTFSLAAPTLKGDNSEAPPRHTWIASEIALTTILAIGICMFTEGPGDDGTNVAENITLAQARDALCTMLTTPKSNRKTCSRIPVRYPNVTDGSSGYGGILKIDVTSTNVCIGNCTGPNSFSRTTATPSASASPSTSQSAAMLMVPLGGSPGAIPMLVLAAAWMFGLTVLSHALPS